MMWLAEGSPRARTVQVTPSGEVSTAEGELLEGKVVATIKEELAPTAVMSSVVPLVRAVQERRRATS
jgi:hypothetical protein